jgi:uncharacterized membrane protein YccC
MESRKFQLTLFFVAMLAILVGFVPEVRSYAMTLMAGIITAYMGANVAQDFAERGAIDFYEDEDVK